MSVYYPNYHDDDYSAILTKYEFTSASNKKPHVYQDPAQLLLRNYISKPSMYENILLYHQLGSGKSCTSISIAEGFKEYITNMGRKIVVLVKNKNIQKNFINELLSRCTKDDYINDEQRDLYYGVNTRGDRAEVINKVNRLVNKNYQFYTYGTFVNRVLGAKDFEKDEFGRNTANVKKVDGKVQRKRAKNAITDLSNTVIIVDEAHNITNNDIYVALFQVLSRSFNYRLVLLSATPMYDNPKEIFELSNLLNVNDQRYQLPLRNDLFKSDSNDEVMLTKMQSKYINNTVLKGGIIRVTEQGKRRLELSLKGKVSFLQTNVETYPSTVVHGTELIHGRRGTSNVVYCQMSKYQYVTYLHALKQDVKTDSKYDISSAIQNVEAVENTQETVVVSKTSSLYKNSSDASTMSYPNNMFGKAGFLSVFEKNSNGVYKLKDGFNQLLTNDLEKYSCKLYKLIQNINSSNGNVFVYSNYVSYGGTMLLKLLLLAHGYKEYRGQSQYDPNLKSKYFVVFDESTNIETRERYRRVFNSIENKQGNIIKIVIGSPIVSEGITLKNVRQVHILEPSWNMSRINQIIGRAVRNYSHQALDLQDRNVDIYKYVSVYSQSKENLETNNNNDVFKFFIDKEKYVLAEEKDRSNKLVERMLKEISFDCQFMKERNMIYDASYDYLPECDYQKCEFECKLVSTSNTPDKSTYNMNISYFEKFDIEYVSDIIRDLFKTYFVWKLDDIVFNIKDKHPSVYMESIFYTLGYLVDSKIQVQDMYGRDGFIIRKNDLYIFNPVNLDVDTSLFTKMLDFSVDTSKYTLNNFVDKQLNETLFDKADSYSNNRRDTKKQSENQSDDFPLSDADVKYNTTIIKKHVIFGTYRQRGTKTSPFGPHDGKFRIVDARSNTSALVNDEDKRKNITGMWIGSFKKGELIDVARFLEIKTKLSIEDYDKDQLGKIIEKHLIEKKAVLK